MSVKWWRTLHQLQSSPRTFSPEYTISLRLNAIAALVLVVWFVAWRYHIARVERAIEDIDDTRALGEATVKPMETRYA
jgi:heme exporter protein C